MKLSEGRQSYLAHRILEVFAKEGLGTVETGYERHALNDIKRAFEQEHERDTRIDALVRRKIDSLSRPVPIGSREWDVLYRKYYDEEARKS
ncbi:MAG TPA: DUF507 family protein [Terriglobales bacterium]|nr:DUF507 family protein [Terriglobales bacterium]